MDTRPVVLALRALKLGDLLVAVPALKALRREFPEHRILYAAQEWLRPILDLVDGIELAPTHGLDVPLEVDGPVDVAVNLHGAGPQSTRRLDALHPARRIGHRCVDPEGRDWTGPAWVEDLHERERWTRLLTWHGIEADPTDLALRRPELPSPRPGAAVVHPGAAYPSRHWPVERFAEVAVALARAGHDVVVTGSASERPRALEVAAAAGLGEEAVLAGRWGLGEMAALVNGAAVVLSADTGAAHLASAFGTPSVVLFGPAPPERWGPPPGPHVVLTDARVRRGDTFAETPDPALLAVGVDEVLQAMRGLRVL